MSSRRPATLLVSFLFSSLVAVGACQSQPVTLLSDPNAILGAAVTTTAAASSVRADATLDGTIAIDPFGVGAGTPVDLAGTSASADIDLADSDARTTFSVPGLLGVAGELIAVDGSAYLKSTVTGPQYKVLSLGQPTPSASGETATVLSGLTDLLSTPGLDPVKGDDVPCGSGTCYTVTIQLTPAELATLGGGLALPSNLPIPIPIPIPDLSGATVDLTVRVEQLSTHLNGVTAVIDLGDAGKLTLQITFSKWDEELTIAAPPADQVAPAG